MTRPETAAEPLISWQCPVQFLEIDGELISHPCPVRFTMQRERLAIAVALHLGLAHRPDELP